MSVEKFAVAGLLATCAVVAAMVVHLHGQQQAQASGDFRNAMVAEIRDASGVVLLRGNLAPANGDDDEIERHAKLAATEAGGHVSGTVEIEYDKDQPKTQEIEFNVTQAPPRAKLTLVLDGVEVLSATADDKGRAEAETDITIPPR